MFCNFLYTCKVCGCFSCEIVFLLSIYISVENLRSLTIAFYDSNPYRNTRRSFWLQIIFHKLRRLGPNIYCYIHQFLSSKKRYLPLFSTDIVKHGWRNEDKNSVFIFSFFWSHWSHGLCGLWYLMGKASFSFYPWVQEKRKSAQPANELKFWFYRSSGRGLEIFFLDAIMSLDSYVFGGLKLLMLSKNFTLEVLEEMAPSICLKSLFS